MTELLIDKRYGGISQDKNFNIPANSFANSENINIQESINYFTLGPILENIGDLESISLTTFQNGTDIYPINTTGKVFYYNISGNFGTAYTFSTTTDKYITNSTIFGTYVYMIGRTKIHRIAVSDAVGTSWSGDVVEDFLTGLDTSEMHPIYNDNDNILYIGCGNSLSTYDGILITNDVLQFTAYENIVSITKQGDLLRIYTYNTKQNKTTLYLWDGIADNPNYIVTWFNIHCYNVIIYGNYDYMITDRSLYLCSGYDKQEIYVFNRYGTNYRDGIIGNYTNVIDTNRNVLILPGDYGIFTYGSYYPQVGNNFNNLYKQTTVRTVYSLIDSGETGAVRPNILFNIYQRIGETDYYQFKGLRHNTYGENISPFVSDNGSLETIIYNMGDYSHIKKLNQIWIGYDLGTNESIQLYVSINGGAYTQVGPLIEDGTIKRFKINQNTFGIGQDFNEIQFKIQINKGSGNGITKVHNIRVFYEYIKA